MVGEGEPSHADILARVASLEARRSERDKALDALHVAATDRMSSIESRLARMDEKLDGIIAVVNESKGAWWAIVRVGTILVVIVGTVGWLWDHLPASFKKLLIG